MATINDIVNLDSRRGDVAAGGGDAGAFQVDTQPLQTLGLYTNLYNQTLYRQTVQDRDAKLAQVAKLSDIDANNLFGKDKDYLVKKLNNLRDFATQYAKNPNLTIDDQLKWQTALSDVNNDYLSGKQRAVTYQARLNDINTNYSGAQKDIKLKELDSDFQNSDIATQLSTGTGYKPVSVELPSPATITFNTLKNGANEVVDVKSTVYNPQANAALASTSVLGISSLANGLKGTEAELQQTANGEAQHWAGMTDAFNAVLTAKDANGGYKYFDANGEFLADKFKTENAANTAIMQPYNALVNLNTYSTQKKQEISNGIYTDKGISYKSPSSLTPDMFDAGIVNFTPNGISKEQLAQGGMFQKYLGDQNVKTFKETGLGIAQQNADTASGRASAYIRKTNQEISKMKNEEDESSYINDLYTKNIKSQKLLQGTGDGNLKVVDVPVNNSIPLFYFNGKSFEALKGINAKEGTPYFDPKTGRKIIPETGGYYKPEIVFKGKSLSDDEITKMYHNFRQNAGANFKGDIHDFINGYVDNNLFEVNYQGKDANGNIVTTNKSISNAALKAMTTKKGQSSVFNEDITPDDGESDQ